MQDDKYPEKKSFQDLSAAEGEALLALEGMPGWEIIEKMLENIIETSKERLTSRKYTKNWNDTLWYQAKHDNAAKLLYLIKNKKDAANKKHGWLRPQKIR